MALPPYLRQTPPTAAWFGAKEMADARKQEKQKNMLAQALQQAQIQNQQARSAVGPSQQNQQLMADYLAAQRDADRARELQLNAFRSQQNLPKPQPISIPKDLEPYLPIQLRANPEAVTTADLVRAADAKRQGTPTELTPAQLAVDKEFAKDYSTFAAQGGAADVQKNLVQLKQVADSLDKGDNLTGGWDQFLPNSVLARINPESVSTKEAVEEVVQRNLRLVLGAQFTEKEGERLISRAYNPHLSQAENAKRVRRLYDQILSAYQKRQDAAAYYEQNGSLRGWQGKLPTIADFDLGGETKLPQSLVDNGVTEDDIQETMKANNLSRDEVIKRVEERIRGR